MKLVLINPVVKNQIGLNNNYRSRHPPLSLAILSSLTPEDWEIVIQDENYNVGEIVADADLVGITSFTSNITRAYEIAAEYRQLNIPVVIGGIHAWARPFEALKYADAIVIKEAELVWGQVCEDVKNHKLKSTYMGAPPSIFAIPNRSVIQDDYPIDSLATSRGCPENCSFCSVHNFSGKVYRRQPLDLIEKDVATIKSNHIFVIDDNFRGFNKRHSEEAIAIFKMMAKYKKDIIIQAPMNICQDIELLDAAKLAGCRLIFIGLETGEEEGLKLVNKRQNIKYGFDFSNIHKAGIGVIGSFILGLDTDTPQKLRDRAKFMIECGVDAVQLTIVTPLPGTALFNQLLQEGRLLYTDFPKDWDRYNMTELTYLPRGFRSVSEFYDLMTELVEEVYSNTHIKMMARRTFDKTASKETTTFAHFTNYSYRDVVFNKTELWKKHYINPSM